MKGQDEIKTVEDQWCGRDCPFLRVYDHPFWGKTAWCTYQYRELSFHDGFLANCLFEYPAYIRKKFEREE
jgi:hypothetical protein